MYPQKSVFSILLQFLGPKLVIFNSMAENKEKKLLQTKMKKKIPETRRFYF